MQMQIGKRIQIQRKIKIQIKRQYKWRKHEKEIQIEKKTNTICARKWKSNTKRKCEITWKSIHKSQSSLPIPKTCQSHSFKFHSPDMKIIILK
jgi:hypothetical protein